MNILHEMLELGRHASHAHVRITKWRPTHAEAMQIARRMEEFENRPAGWIYDTMISGRAHIFGARIEIRQ